MVPRGAALRFRGRRARGLKLVPQAPNSRPQPQADRTTLPFALPGAARVEMHVYDLLGRRVAVVADGMYEAGRHAAQLDGRQLASGVYVVRAVMQPEHGGATQTFTRRITLVR